MTTAPNFSILELPKPLDGPQDGAQRHGLAEKYRRLRLQSLKVAPEAFASTYETESQRGLDQTLDRLSNPKARHFIAVEVGGTGEINLFENGDVDGICKSKWLGLIVLIGPVKGTLTAQADPLKTVVGGDLGSSQRGSRTQAVSPIEFVLNGVFVEPAARGKGVGKALIDTALARVKDHGDSVGAETCVTMLVNAENEEARKLYRKAGFAVVGQETYTQEPRGVLGEDRVVERVALKMQLDIL